MIVQPEDVAVPDGRHGVGQVRVPEPGIEQRYPGLGGGDELAFDECASTAEGVFGLERVVAVLNARPGDGVLAYVRQGRAQRFSHYGVLSECAKMKVVQVSVLADRLSRRTMIGETR